MRDKTADIAIGLVFLVGGVGIAVHATGLRSMPGTLVGSGLVPTITGACMAFAGLLLAAGQFLRGRPPSSSASPPSSPSRARARGADTWGYPLAILALLVGFVALMPFAGFVVSGILFTTGVARLGGAGWIGAAVAAVVLTIALNAVFVHALGVPLPRGMFG